MGYSLGPCCPGGAAVGQPLRAGKLHTSPTKHRRPEAGVTDLAVATSAVVGGVGAAEMVEEPTQTIGQDPQCKWPIDYSKLDDKALIRLIAHAHTDALSELYDRYNRLLFRLALNAVGDQATAEEITLDVFT